MKVLGFLILVRDIFFFQAEDGIRGLTVTGVQTCALPIYSSSALRRKAHSQQPQARLSPASNAPSAGEWKSYGGDLGSNRYAALDQINKDNFNRLEVAWRFKTDSFGARPEVNFEGTPLMVGGILYCTVGSRPDLVALDAGTRELLW